MSTLDEYLPVRSIEEVVCSFGTIKDEEEEETEANFPGKFSFHDSTNVREIVPVISSGTGQDSVDSTTISSLDVEKTKRVYCKKGFRRDIVRVAGVNCDFCDKNAYQGTIVLHKFERILAVFALRKLKSFLGINRHLNTTGTVPSRLCKHCFDNLYLFRNRLKSFLDKRRKEKRRMMDGNSHGYQCRCANCQNKYGGLPVLLKGIEEQHKIQSSQQGIDHITPQSYTNIEYSYQSDMGIAHPMMSSFPDPMHQVSVKYEEIKTETYIEQPSYLKPNYFDSMDHGFIVQTPQTSDQANANFSTSIKTDSFSNTSADHYSSSNTNEINDFDMNLFEASSSFVEQSSQSDDKTLLPTLLTDLEGQSQSFNQPSTSSGFQGHSHSSDDKLPRRTMTCIHCDKKFTHKGDFNKHLRKHTKEKPYKCSFCQKPFSHTSNLHRHERIHSGDRPYKCEFCDKRFNRTDKLESHKNSKFCKNRRRK